MEIGQKRIVHSSRKVAWPMDLDRPMDLHLRCSECLIYNEWFDELRVRHGCLVEESTFRKDGNGRCTKRTESQIAQHAFP